MTGTKIIAQGINIFEIHVPNLIKVHILDKAFKCTMLEGFVSV